MSNGRGLYYDQDLEIGDPRQPVGWVDEQAIDARFGRIIFRFPVLHRAWDSDLFGFVVIDPQGERRLVLSDEGEYYLAPIEHLQHKLDEYRLALDLTEQALLIVEQPKKSNREALQAFLQRHSDSQTGLDDRFFDGLRSDDTGNNVNL